MRIVSRLLTPAKCFVLDKSKRAVCQLHSIICVYNYQESFKRLATTMRQNLIWPQISNETNMVVFH